MIAPVLGPAPGPAAFEEDGPVRRKPLILLLLAATALAPAACAKPPVDATTGSSLPPGNPTSGNGSITTTSVALVTTSTAGVPTTAKVRSLPCETMNRFVQDLFIVEKAKDLDQAKKDEIVRSVEVHAGELKQYVPALAPGVDVRVEYVKAFLAGTSTPEQKSADDAQGKAFEDWYKTNACT